MPFRRSGVGFFIPVSISSLIGREMKSEFLIHLLQGLRGVT